MQEQRLSEQQMERLECESMIVRQTKERLLNGGFSRNLYFFEASLMDVRSTKISVC